MTTSKVEQDELPAVAESFQFSVPRHVTFLAGYMDAVGRFLTTDSVLWAPTALDPKGDPYANRLFEAAIGAPTVVENWSKEFVAVVSDFLGIDDRSRFGFYLIEYICWFKEFTRNARCLKLDCAPVSAGTLGQAAYLLELEGDQRVLLLFQYFDKSKLGE